MKKMILLLLATIFVAGCSGKAWKTAGAATLGSLMLADIILDDGKHDFDNYVKEHGAPTSSYKLSSGETIYSFIKPCPSSAGTEEIIVTVKEENYIQDIKTKTACPTK